MSITELKAHLAEYLRRVEAGEVLYVTSHGREIAELHPPDPVRATLLQMVADGEAEWNGEAVSLSGERFLNPGRPVSDIVLEDRGLYIDPPEPSE